ADQPDTTQRPSDERTGREIRTSSGSSASSVCATQAASAVFAAGLSTMSPQRQAREPGSCSGSSSRAPNAARTCGGGGSGVGLTSQTLPRAQRFSQLPLRNGPEEAEGRVACAT